MIKIYIGLHVKYSLFLSNLMKRESSLQIFEKSNLIKTRPAGVELLHVKGQTDRHGEGNSRFSQFREHA